MCIAILNQTGTISLKTFKTCWNNNPDGAGFCYFDGKKIQIIKEMKSVKYLHSEYIKVRQKYPSIDIAIHFRVATHGRVNITNCHPFKISDTSAFIHNGIISHMEAKPEFSDTYQFNELIMKGLPANFTQNNAVLELLGGYIGYSKLVIINGTTSAIVNEDLGHWNEGNWYSNNSYKPAEPKKPSNIVPVKNSIISSTSKPGNFEYWDGGAWHDSFDVDEYVNDKKSKAIDKAPKKCDCCLNSSAPARWVPSWYVYACDDCLHDFGADLVGKPIY